jgi:hypothetical protein
VRRFSFIIFFLFLLKNSQIKVLSRLQKKGKTKKATDIKPNNYKNLK